LSLAGSKEFAIDPEVFSRVGSRPEKRFFARGKPLRESPGRTLSSPTGLLPAILLVLVVSLIGVFLTPVCARDVGSVQTTDDSIRERYGHRDPAARLLSDVMRLISEYYVKALDERDVLADALQKLSLGLPPHCTEDFEPLADCKGDVSTCFMEAIDGIARCSGTEPENLVVKALGILLRDLDHNTSLLDQALLKELQISTSGKFGGVGMVVSPKDGDYVVVSCFDSSPASRAGIRAGDMIMEIDGTPLHGLSLLEVLKMVRGSAGTRMTVKIKGASGGKIRKAGMVRRIIRIPPVRFAMLKDRMGYLRIVNFQENTAREVVKALNPLVGHGRGSLRGLVLDLRDNPGGLFSEAIRVADIFVHSSVITSVRGRNPKLNQEFRSGDKQVFPEIPIVVLINKGSASASEILAGALQGRPNVLVVGERSFGKASVQAVFPLSNGMAVRLTTAHYYTSYGKDIEGKGLEPDVAMESPQNPVEERVGVPGIAMVETDQELKNALHYLVSGRFPGRTPFSSLY